MKSNNNYIFNLKNYKSLLKLFKESNLTFSNFKGNEPASRKIILRHDIDFCPTRALQIAELENKLSVFSTFFFLVNTDFYNLQFEENKQILRKIINLGHSIGLHFDASLYENCTNISEECKKEIKVLENIINDKIDIVSFHRPSKEILNMNDKIGDLEHTYMDKFIKKITYCSDSEGSWRYNTPMELIEENKNNNQFVLHLLLHPIWWTTPGNLNAAEKVDFHLKKKYNDILNTAAKNCKPYSKFLVENITKRANNH